MKKISMVVMTVCLALSVGAAPSYNAKLESWLKKTLTVCPDATWEFVGMVVPGETSFDAYRITTESSGGDCRDAAYVFFSGESGQILSGQIIQLPEGDEKPEVKIRELLSSRMNSGVEVRVHGKPGADGIRSLLIDKESPDGIVPMRGWLDATGNFLVMGRRGDINRDPGTSLLESLGAENGVSRGPDNAQIRIVELSDLQCPACLRAHQLLEPIIRENEGRIHYTRIDMPITDYHDWTMKAALGAEAVRTMQEDVYWDYVDYIFANQPNINVENIDQFLLDFVEGSGLDADRFSKLVASEKTKKKLNEQAGAAYSNGIFGTPTFIVNGRVIYYGRGADNIAAYLRNLLD